MKMKAEHRISMRTNEQIKRYLETAAILSGFNNLSAFVLSTAYREAQRVVHEAQGRTLSDRDRNLVLDALENPALPNAQLKQIMANAHNLEQQD